MMDKRRRIRFMVAPLAAVVVMLCVAALIYFPSKQSQVDRIVDAREDLIVNPQDKDALEILEAGLRSDKQYIRTASIRAFGYTGSVAEPYVPVIADFLFHDNPYTRRDASLALLDLGDHAKPAIPQLILALDDQESADVPAFAAMALGSLGTDAEEALPALRRRMYDPSYASIYQSAILEIEQAILDSEEEE